MGIGDMYQAQIDAEDARRFVWWFDDSPKPPNMMNEFLQGVREHWTLDQWRAHCDKWMTDSTRTSAEKQP
jgi:hypothetical protein